MMRRSAIHRTSEAIREGIGRKGGWLRAKLWLEFIQSG